MKPELVVSTQAEDDARAGYQWYESNTPGLGEEFLAHVRASLDTITETPLLYGRAIEDLRRAPVKRFPYGVFYRADDYRVFVVGILHSSRDLGVLKGRE